MKKYLILLLIVVFSISMILMGISCKEKILTIKEELRLTNNPAWDGFPSWSPDGKKIAFIRGGIIYKNLLWITIL